jgi:hypothetical protein
MLEEVGLTTGVGLLRRYLVEETLLARGKGRSLGGFQAAILACAVV